MQQNIKISDDKELLDVEFIYQFLTKAYWSEGRTKAQVQLSIDHSDCFGLYLDGTQIGFARLISDRLVFAYLMDVFIDPEHRGHGYSKLLLSKLFNHPEYKQVKSWYLKTLDANGLYTKFGFTPLSKPEKFMEYITK